MRERFIILGFTDWHSLIVMGVGAVIAIGSVINNAIKEMKKKKAAAEQRRLSRPLDSGETGRVQARTDATTAATAQRVERARVLNEPPPLGQGLTQRGRIEAALKTRVAAQMKRRAEIEQTVRAQRAARQTSQARQQRPQQRSSPAPSRPVTQQSPSKPVPAAPQQVAQRRQPVATSAPRRLMDLADTPPLSSTGHAPTQPARVLAGRTLRQAFIWHEILDRPVALCASR